MNFFQAFVLGLVQGVTEFLPISSSGHLAIFTKILNLEVESNLLLGVMLHFGTLFSVVVCFYHEIGKMLKENRSEFLHIIIATIPAGIFGLLFSKIIDSLCYETNFLVLSFLFTATILLLVDRFNRNTETTIRFKNSIPIGLMQCLALFPGISRSGVTISAGVFTGLKKEKAISFSFILSIPIILGSLLLESYSIAMGECSLVFNFEIVVALLSSFVFGVLSIKFMIAVMKKISYKWFSLYIFIVAMLTYIFF